MRFCPQCGAPLLAQAKFCVQCGHRLSSRGYPAASGKASKPGADVGFLSVFSGLVVAGALIAWVLVVREQRFDTIVNQTATSTGAQSVQASGMTLPAGHPKVELPPEALKFIEQVRTKAEQHPDDVAAWTQYGDVAYRAALLDPSFYSQAAQAYAHVLKLDPDNLSALRGMGNINYDRHRYDEATAAYEHYLKQKPDDPAVRTDLGTLYLYTGNPDQAIVQYNKALAIKPDFFEAYFNLGVAYIQMGQAAKAQEALKHALALAPDDRARKQVRDLLAEAGAPVSTQNVEQSANAAPQTSTTSQAAEQPQEPTKTFAGAIEAMVRQLPIAGSRVKAVQWPSQFEANVLLSDFPMDQMPPFAKEKFLADIKDGIEQAKRSFSVTAPFKLNLADAKSGKVLESVVE